MIGRDEIETKACEFEIHPANVQRDYIFGWILSGLFTVSELKDRVFLKGGNALRKGYFANTRFSPDLDFGTPVEVTPKDVMEGFSKICAFIQAKTGVRFLPEEHRIAEWYPPTDNLVTDLKVYDVRLYFQDFYGQADHLKIRVSIDFTRYDRVVLPLQTRPLIHPYSDAPGLACTLQCMKLEEIIATKLKCLLQRQHAPDLFDYVYSIRLLGGKLNRRELLTTFIRKTIFANNPHFVKNLLLNSPLQFFRNVWHNSIVCARQVAIGVDEAISFYLKDLNDLFRVTPEGRSDTFQYFGPDLRNPIMEAGRTLTCLRINYDSISRVVEPYSLKFMQRKDGVEREYLYVYDRDGGNSGPGLKSLIAEKVSSIETTEQKFEPRWPVELSKSGEIPDNHYFFDPNRPTKAPSRRSLSGSLEYVYRCPQCGKIFKRKHMNSKLNAHKNKHGYDCTGSFGVYLRSTFYR